jgi:hypothetical protein
MLENFLFEKLFLKFYEKNLILKIYAIDETFSKKVFKKFIKLLTGKYFINHEEIASKKSWTF